MRTPGDSLDGSDVLGELVRWRLQSSQVSSSPSERERRDSHLVHLVEYKEPVIIPSTRQLITLLVPLETTDLLPMRSKLANKVSVHSDVAVVDALVVRARGEDGVVPRQRADSSSVTRHAADGSLGLGVPDLHAAVLRPDGELMALQVRGEPTFGVNRIAKTHPLDPSDGSDRIGRLLIG